MARKQTSSNGNGVNIGVQELPQVDEKQLLAIAALVSGCSDSEAAERAGVDRSTVFRWRTSSPAFAAALNLARQEIWSGTVDALRAAVGKAVRILIADMDCDVANVRSAAARDVLRLTGVPALAPTGKVTSQQVSMAWDSERSVSVTDVLAMGF